MTALVVDDEEGIREVITSLLETIPNLKIRTARNGSEAYTSIRTQKPDILYSDIRMPEMTGDQLLEALVTDGTKIPTLVMTGNPTTNEAMRAVFYSLQMYTEEQKRLMGLPSIGSFQECEEYLGQLRRQDTLGNKKSIAKTDTNGEIYRIPFAILLFKPIDAKDLRYRTSQIQEKLYN